MKDRLPLCMREVVRPWLNHFDSSSWELVFERGDCFAVHRKYPRDNREAHSLNYCLKMAQKLGMYVSPKLLELQRQAKTRRVA